MSIVRVVIAIVVFLVIMRIGLAMVRALARPIPEPPPPGELRKVKIQYRCEMCGTEVRMTMSNDQDPEAPRHCMQEMELTKKSDV
jgi:DNA-directed RNA polymerase subunit RPC12/RpoP